VRPATRPAGHVDKGPKCYFDHSGTVADEFRNEFVAELSFPLRTAEASSAGDGRGRLGPVAE
jgi:hypothetical protein